MATILDIAGKPLPARNRLKRRLRAQDMRDLLKILIVLMLIMAGYFAFAPTPHGSDQSENIVRQSPRNV